MTEHLQAPFPWFGGKSRAAPLIWERLGDVNNYVEPFAGSLAVLLGAPRVHRFETINDLDGFVANFWRAVSRDPESVAHHADWPVNEADLHARHIWLVNHREDLTARLMGDPDYYDAMIAGWWVWGQCAWIGGGWCSGKGPWTSVDGRLTKNGTSQGVKRTLPHLGDQGQGILNWFVALHERLRRVRVCCGDWSRVLGPSPTTNLGVTAVVLDPPYSSDLRDQDCYACDSSDVASLVRQWAIEHGDDPMMRIALCGYEGEHDMPSEWRVKEWTASGAYMGKATDGKAAQNRFKERIWFSPHCLTGEPERQICLWGAL